MPLKSNWVNGESFAASDVNAHADAINTATDDVEGLTADVASLTGDVAALTVTVPIWFEIHSTYDQRAVGYGDNTLGFLAPAAFTLTSVVYRGETADASGSSTVEVRKNGSQITGTSKSITSANQWTYDSDVTVTGLSVSIAAGDVLRPYISAVGTTPGDGFSAVLIGTTSVAVS